MSQDRCAALAGLFDVPTLLAIEDAVHMYARTLETFGATHPEFRADAERLRSLRYVFADATAAKKAG